VKLSPGRLRYGEEATLVEHLGELRGRIVIILVAVTVGFGVAYGFHGHLIHWLELALPENRRNDIVTLSVTEPFLTSVQVSLYAGFLLAMPVILWQIWMFFSPAVDVGARRMVLGLVAFATVLGAGGLAFGYFVALPASLKFLTNYDANIYHIQIRARDYLSFASLVLLAVTVVFEVPIVILGLVTIRVLSYAKLKRNRRLGYVLMAAIAVALPGVDPVTTTIEMIPLMVLFEGSIWMALIMERRRRRSPLGTTLEAD
jgi:sec-independent protein translocase protein TatC